MPDGKNKSAIQNPKSEILIAEDSPIQAEMLRRVLVKNGYSVLVAKDGAEGLAMAKEQKPRLVISDIMMPVMDGYEMCKTIKSDETLKDIPVILLTSLTDPEDVIKGLDAGADSYVTKPFDEKLILSKIASLSATAQLSKADMAKVRLNVLLGGVPQTIEVYPQHIFNLLSSTYENAVIQNRHLSEARDEVEKLNSQLQEKVFEITESEARFRTLVQTIPDIVYRIDIDGRFIFVNNSIQRLGYKPEELIGEHFSRIILPADVTRVSRAAVLEGYKGRVTGDKDAPKLFDERRAFERKTGGLEVRLVKKGGEPADSGLIEKLSEEVLVVEVNSSGMYEISKEAKRPEFIGTVGVIRDISDRKLLEAELIRYKDHLEEMVVQQTADVRFKSFLLDNASDSIFVHDLEGNFAYVNEAACRSRGYTKEELVSIPLQKLDAPVYAEKIKERMESMLKTGRAIFESAHIRKDGTLMPIEIHAQVVEIEGKEMIVSVVRDITERKKSEMQLANAEARYRTLFEQAPAGILVIDPETTLPLEFNYIAHHQLGYSREEFSRLRTSDYEVIESAEEIKAHRDKILLLTHGEFETLHRTKNGEIRNVLVTVQVLELSTLPVLYTIFRDITELKHAEEELHRLNAELEQRVIARTAQLDTANKELEAFSYSISHDLRAPLRAITGFSNILLEDYSGKVDDEGKRLLDVVKANAIKMNQLIDDILSFSRAGRKEFQMVEINMEGLAKEVVEELRQAFAGRNVQIDIKPLPSVIGDRPALHQVFTNLISNAIKFTKQKETALIEIGALTEESAEYKKNEGTENEIRSAGSEIIYYVKDNGAGFDMQYAEKLFGVFQRLHSAEEFEGTGIGLSIVKAFIKKHGGMVWAEGKVGEGAVFYFSLPKGQGRTS